MEQREDDGGHEARLSENIHNLNRRNMYDVFDSHRFALDEIVARDDSSSKCSSRSSASFP